MNTSQTSTLALPDRLKRWCFLLPVLAVGLVFVGVEQLRDRAQLQAPAVTFYSAANASGSPPDEQVELQAGHAPKPRPAMSVALLAPGSSPKVLAADLSGRLRLSAAIVVFFVAFVTLACLCGLAIYGCKCLPLARRGKSLCFLAVLLVVGIVPLLIWLRGPRAVTLLLRSFDGLATTLFQQTTVQLVALDKYIGSFSLVGAAMLAVTAAVILDGVCSSTSELPDLRRRCAALRTTLAAGAAVLASAVIVVGSLQNWILGFIDDPDAGELRVVAESWTMAIGTYWTLVLVAAYLPAAAIVHHASIRMADARSEAEKGEQTRDQWMEEQGLNVSIKGQVTRALMLLAPWLSGGPLAEIGKQFLG